MLAPDFSGNLDYLGQLFETAPEVFAHNVETVPRIFKRIRPGFRYDRSLGVLTASREAGLVTKSNLILGMGETREEITEALRDLHAAGTEIITITQYLRPSPRHHPVERWVKPEEFVELAAEATELGFAGVMSGPLVRSSYRAGRLYRQALDSRGDRLAPSPALWCRKAAAPRTEASDVHGRWLTQPPSKPRPSRRPRSGPRRPARRRAPTRPTWAGSGRSSGPTS